jgi:ABC-type bacteriocin/lantibiotic exporter with double-glycine peptidase domain
MLVAFQMFAGKLSQTVMRLVGLWQQFQQARLAFHYADDLPHLFENLSLAIARAQFKRPQVLSFDEATSALDAESDDHFAKAINGLEGSVMMLFITHALPRALCVDEVVHLSADGAPQPQVVPQFAPSAAAAEEGA